MKNESNILIKSGNYRSLKNIEIKADENGLYKICYSTEEACLREDSKGKKYWEILSNEDVDLSRLNNHAPFLFNHDPNQIIGSVNKAWIEDKKGFAFISLSSTAGKFKTLIEEGHLRKISHGYEFNENTFYVELGKDENGIPIILVFGYLTFELSVVPIPADDNCSFKNFGSEISLDIEKLKKEGKIMTKKKSGNETNDDALDPATAVPGANEAQNEAEATNEELKQKLKKAEEDLAAAQAELEDKETAGKSDEELEAEVEKEEKRLRSLKQKLEKNKNKDEKSMSMKEILELGNQFKQIELATEFALKGKTVSEFKDALLQKNLSNPSNPSHVPNRGSSKGFSLAGLIYEQAEKQNGEHTKYAKSLFDSSNFKSKHNGFVMSRDFFKAQNTTNTAAAIHTDQRQEVLVSPLFANSIWSNISTAYPTAEGYGEVTYPIIGSRLTVEDGVEGQAATESQLDITKSVKFNPRSKKVKIVLTKEMQMQNSLKALDSIIYQMIEKEMLDNRNNVILQEIISKAGVQEIDFTGETGIDFDKVVEFETLVGSKNIDLSASSYVVNSKMAGKLKTTQRFGNYGEEILRNGEMNGYKVNLTNATPLQNKMLFVDKNNVATIDWNYIEIVVNPYIDDGGGLTIYAYDYYDVQVLRPEAIVKGTNISFA